MEHYIIMEPLNICIKMVVYIYMKILKMYSIYIYVFMYISIHLGNELRYSFITLSFIANT